MLFELTNYIHFDEKSCIHFTHGDRFQAAENKAVQLARKCVQTKYVWFKSNQAHDNLSSQFYGEGEGEVCSSVCSLRCD